MKIINLTVSNISFEKFGLLLLLLKLYILNFSHICLSSENYLQNFNSKSILHTYKNKFISSECARFNIHYPVRLVGISFVVKADSIGSEFQLRVFGNEGKAVVPYYEDDIIEPVTYKIQKKGLDTFFINIVNELVILGNQFFVVLQYFDTTIRLVSDKSEKTPFCISQAGEVFYHQLMKINDQWVQGKYGYAVTVKVEYVIPQNIIYKDVTKDLGIDDSLYFNKSISLFDINNDKLIDILIDGRIYLNNDNFNLKEATNDYKLYGKPKANLFLDINKDGLQDIVFLGIINDSTSINEKNAKVFINKGENLFSEQAIQIEGLNNPQSFSIADLNNDGYQDIVVIQCSDSAKDKILYILLNNKENQFINISNKIHVPNEVNGIITCSVIDFNNDKLVDISLVSGSGEIILFENKSNLNFENVSSIKFQFDNSSNDGSIYQYGTAITWIDFNNDGLLDVANPNGIIFIQQRTEQKKVSLELYKNNGEYEYNLIPTNYINELTNEYQQSAICGDINNDGFQDIIITSGCLCRDICLFQQNNKNSFECVTHLSGLTNRSFGPDGILTDLNNDGKLDFITCQGEFLRVFKNISIDNYFYVDFDFSDFNNPHNIKTEVIVSGVRFVNHLQNGRGFLVQNAPRLHFGLENNSKIDSVIISDINHTQILTNLTQINKIYFLGEINTLAKNDDTLIVNAFPNPFQSQLEFEYYVPEKGNVMMSIYSSDGTKVLDLIDEYKEKGNYKLKWNAKGKNGEDINSGTYIYKIELNKLKSEGKLIKIN